MSRLTPKPGILEIEPYVGGKSEAAGVANPVKLASNESALGPSPKAMEAYLAEARKLHRYPSSDHKAMREALGKKYGLDPDRLIMGGGSDQILDLACRAYAGEGDEVLYPEYGFLMYGISALAVGARPVKAKESNYTVSVDNLLAAVTPRTRVLFLANPANPTGTCIGAAELRRLHAGLPGNVILVLDSAYAEFVERDDYDSGVELAGKADNVLMTRTFSKIYGLGGARIGWAYASKEIIDVFNRIREPFNVSSPALAAGLAALDDDEFVKRALEHNRAWRPWLTEEFRSLGLGVTESETNFVLVRFPESHGLSAADADRFITARGYILRRMESYGLPDCLRVTVGLEEDNRGVVAAAAAYVAAHRRAAE